MRFRTLFLFLVLAAVGLFALLNWQAFTTPVPLSVVFGTVEAPLGLIMLGVVFLLGAMCLAYLVYVQGTALMESRRHTRALQQQRELAEKAEASRFTELRDLVNTELRAAANNSAETRMQVLARLDQLEQRMRLALDETGHTLDSHLLALEDRIEHGAAGNGGLPADRTAH